MCLSALSPAPVPTRRCRLREWRPAFALDDAKIQLAAIDIHTRHFDAHQIAQPKRVTRAASGERVRAAISLVISLNGNNPTSNTENATAARQLISNEKFARRPRIRSPEAKASPPARIGPISGEISIAPIITAALSSTSPKVAMTQLSMISSR